MQSHIGRGSENGTDVPSKQIFNEFIGSPGKNVQKKNGKHGNVNLKTVTSVLYTGLVKNPVKSNNFVI